MSQLYNSMMMARRPVPDSRPVALTVAGSDSGGGAGIQADLKTMEAGGAFGTSAVTAVTAQNTRGVESSYVLPVEEIEAQIDAVRSDFDVRAVKTGMLATAPVIESVAKSVATLDAPLVVDPVMVATTGDRLLDPNAEEAYQRLLKHGALTTPNVDEAEVLTGIDVASQEDAVEAGTTLLETGVDAALVKGGHLPGDRIRDVLVTRDGVETFEHPRIETNATHGSGCALASAIATRLAHGDTLLDAVEAGVSFMERAVRYHLDVGEGPGSVHHAVALRDRAARQPTQEIVEGIVRRFVEADVSRLVPEVGMNVVAATPYAEMPGETAAVEGRITRTLSGIAPNRGVRFGASSHVARFLLSAREYDPSLRIAINCRFDEAIGSALEVLDGTVVEFDRGEEPDPDQEGHTMGWAARKAFERADGTPVAVYDSGAVGKEPITRLLATDPATGIERTLALSDAVQTD